MAGLATSLWAQSGLELAGRAEEAEARGDYASAAELFLEAHVLMPTKPELLYLAARNLARTGEAERAVQLLARALDEELLIADPLSRDTAFQRLEADPGFRRLLERARQRELEIDRPLRDELLELAEADGAFTERLVRILRESGYDSVRVDTVELGELREGITPVRARFAEIVRERGWPGFSLVGRQGAAAAWQLAQHADAELQREVLPLLEEAANNGEASRRLWAYLLDRVRVGRGEKQLYGTQFKWSAEEGGWVPHPIEDPEGLEARRAEVGLEPMEDYARMMKEMYGEVPPP